MARAIPAHRISSTDGTGTPYLKVLDVFKFLYISCLQLHFLHAFGAMLCTTDFPLRGANEDVACTVYGYYALVWYEYHFLPQK